jgi:flagellar motor switch protein FliM
MPKDGNVLARKLRSRGVAPSPLPETDLVGDEFARRIEDKMRPLVKTIVGAIVLECAVEKLSEALARISVPAVLGLVDVEGAESRGLLGIDTDLAYHLIDLMLGGDPSVPQTPTARTFTGIDMALCRLHLDALVAAFVEAIEAGFRRPLTKAFSVSEQRQDVSQLRLAPDYVDVLTLSIALDLGDAARTGSFVLVLPLAVLDVVRASIRGKTVETPAERADDLWRANMRLAAATSPVALDAVLHRQRLSMAALLALRPGDVVELPVDALDAVQLCIRQPGSRSAQVSAGRLGAFQGHKVVKLRAPIDPRVCRSVESAL